jgi:hypothetical protein
MHRLKYYPNNSFERLKKDANMFVRISSRRAEICVQNIPSAFGELS